MLLDKLPSGIEEDIGFENLENIFKNDAYIPPEMIKPINLEKPNYKTDSWNYKSFSEK